MSTVPSRVDYTKMPRPAFDPSTVGWKGFKAWQDSLDFKDPLQFRSWEIVDAARREAAWRRDTEQEEAKKLQRERLAFHRADVPAMDQARAERRKATLAPADATALERLASADYDVNDLDQVPRPEPLITGILDARTLAMVSGKFGTYKSFLLLSWAAHLATGQAWAGHEVPEPMPVVYVAAEGVAGFQGRMLAWRKRFGEIPRGMLSVIGRPVRLNAAEDLDWLQERIGRARARLVLFDTLHRCAPGVEENSAKEMGAVVEAVDSLKANTGATMLFAHHTGHAGQRARGSSVNEDSVDTAFVVKLGTNGETEDPEPEHAANPGAPQVQGRRTTGQHPAGAALDRGHRIGLCRAVRVRLACGHERGQDRPPGDRRRWARHPGQGWARHHPGSVRAGRTGAQPG